MADDKFSLGDILWEYADYTPPAATPAKPAAPLPPETPQQPTVPPVSPGITSPQPVAPAGSPKPAPKAPGGAAAPRPAQQPLPANAPLPANQPPAAPPKAPQAAPKPAPAAPQAPQPAPAGQPRPTPPANQPASQTPPPASKPTPAPPAQPAGQPPQAPPASGASSTPNQTPPAPGAGSTPNQAPPASGASPAPNQTPPAPGAGPTPNQAPPAPGAGSTPNQAPPAPGAGSAPNQAPPAPAPAQGAQPGAQGQQPPQPESAPQGSPEGQPAPAPDQPVETGVPLDDGPELIAFTPDPKAAQAEAAGQEGAAQAPQPGQPTQGQPTPGGPAAPSGAPGPGPRPAGGPQARPAGPGGAAAAPAQEAFQPFRERKGKAPEPPPPDAPPAQLATEYGPGLSALKTKCAVSGVLTGVLVVLSLLDSGLLPFLTGLVPTEIALWAGLALFAVCGGLCFDVLQQGLLQLTNRAPNGDTLALFAAVFTLADGVTLVAAPFREVTLPFFAPCALVLTFHLLGQYCDRSAKFQACRTAASVAQPYVVTQDANVLGGQPAFRKWLGLPRGFGSQIRTTSQTEAQFRRLTPVLLAACFALSLVTTVAHHQPWLVLWSLSALFCAAATLGATLSLALPLRLLGGKLAKLGVALAGWPGLLAAKGCKAALLLDQDVYPPGTIALTGSRVFGSLSMERTVSYTASVIRASGSGLRYLFDKLLRAEGSSYLPIDKIVMQDTGLIGQCQDQQILVGNSDFMSRQGIALPPGIKAKDAVFCAVDRELVGMFVLRYTLHPSILPSLQTMIAHRISPVMATRDFNLTPHRLRLWGRLSVDQITFPDLQRRVVLSGPRQIHGTTLVAVLCREGVAPFSQALVASQRIRRAAAFSQWFVHIGACVGVVITAALSSAGALTAMSPWNLSLFLLLWFVPVLMLSLWTTQY